MKNFHCPDCGNTIKPPEVLPPQVLGQGIGTFEIKIEYLCPNQNCKRRQRTTIKGSLEISEITVKPDKTRKH